MAKNVFSPFKRAEISTNVYLWPTKISSKNMIESSNASISKIVVHQMGCKAEGGQLQFSRRPLEMAPDEVVGEVKKRFFVEPFSTDANFNFEGKPSLEQNLIYAKVSELFARPDELYDISIDIATWLFENSNHPKIRGGEFYMAHFEGCVVDGQTCNAVGIFKSENKETFLKVFRSEENVEIDPQEGINIRRLDKGCIIFNIERQDGYRVCAVDNINKGQEARFWMEDFLGVKPRQDDFFFTNSYLQMCRGFVDDVFNEENHVARADQIDLMNKSIDFFKENTKFDHSDFENKVMAEPDIISAFNDYKLRYEADHEMPETPVTFDISPDAVNAEKRHFRSILKLDKNFHVYVHGSRYYMEKGYDEQRDLNYYKLFFKTES